ncbi:MAG: nitrate- and nitrite sensing domain-containing protein [Actinocatenispora sp.]
MSVRTWPIRSRLVALVALPIACLVLFWGFANYLTFGDGLRLYYQGALNDHIAAPAQDIVNAMQEERRASMVYLASPTASHRAAVDGARKVVDRKIGAYRTDLSDGAVRSVADDRTMTLAHDELTKLDGLPKLREKVNDGTITRDRWMSSVTGLLDGVTVLYTQVTTFPDESTTTQERALQALAHARELRSREDAILAGALAEGRFTTASYRSFVQAVGVKDFAYHEAFVSFSGQHRTEFDTLTAKTPFPELAAMEKSAVEQGRPGRSVPVDATQWRTANHTALDDLYDFEDGLADGLVEHAKTPSYWIFGRLAVAFLLGAVAIGVSVLVARRLSRSLVHQLRALRDSARDLAWVRLPSVVDRLSAGKPVDVDTEIPTLPAGRDEIGQVSESFNEVGRTAVRAATDQAELRAGVSNVFLNIARRSQTLLHRQISHLDVMERKAAEPEALEDLFRIDHLATRMRRNAENLVILGGGQAGRQWNRPVLLQDVLRSAASEVEQYERVKVLPFPPVMLAGSVVSDVVHLAAELIDNATAFSPPHTRVTVTGQLVPKGFAVEIEDRGLGMTPDVLAASNEWLSKPPEFDVLALSENARLGMFVVARIAARHGAKVLLRGSPYGGTTAIMLLPAELVAGSEDADELMQADAGRVATEEPVPSPIPAPAPMPAPIEPPAPDPERLPVGASDDTDSWPRLTALPGSPAAAAEETTGLLPVIDPASPAPAGPLVTPEPVERDESSADPEPPGWPDASGWPAQQPWQESVTPRPVPREDEQQPWQESATPRPAPSDDAHQTWQESVTPRPVPPDDAPQPWQEPATPQPSPSDDAPRLPTRMRGGMHRAPSPGPEPAVAEGPAPPPPIAEQPAEPERSQVSEGDTHMGLPKRVRQANLAPGLRATTTSPEPDPPQQDSPSRPQRSPEEIRSMMSSYQRGTVRGRESSARLDDDTVDGDEPRLGAPPHAPTNLTTVEVGKEDG